MGRWLIYIAAVLGGLAVLGIAAGRLGLLTGSPPDDLGVREGKLKAPSSRPNSVSSQTVLWPGHAQAAYAQIAPLALVGGSGPATLAKLRQLVENTPGARVLQAEGDYLRCEFTTPLMRYTDDVEFWFDPAAQVVQLRSASRLGYSDRGANRARIEALRARLAAG
jgi:uncharacterized protein (DUF1499 family)